MLTSVLVFGCWLMDLLKADQIYKMITIFTQNDDFVQKFWLSEKSLLAQFVTTLTFCRSLRLIT